MGQIISDVTEVLDYKKSKKEATESGFFDIIVGKEGAAKTFVERTRAVGDKI